MDAAEARQRERQHIFVVNGASDFLDVVRELFEGEGYNITTTNFVPKTFDQIEVIGPSLQSRPLRQPASASETL